MADNLQWMPLYVADYLADTGHLGPLEHGAYLLLILHYWRTGPLPADETLLRKIARMTPAQWRSAREVLLKFFQRDNNIYRHKRIDFERARAETINAAKRQAGSRGGNAAKQSRSRRAAELPAKAQQNDAPSQSPSPSSEPKGSSAVKRRPQVRADEADMQAFHSFYEAYPRHEAKQAALNAYRIARQHASQDALVAGAQRYAAHVAGQDPRYTKLPATWLKNQCWDDEYGGHYERQDDGRSAHDKFLAAGATLIREKFGGASEFVTTGAEIAALEPPRFALPPSEPD